MASVAGALRLDQDVTIGLVGPHALVERIVLAELPGGSASAPSGPEVGQGGPLGQGRPLGQGGRPAELPGGTRRRLLMAAYRSEHEAAERVARLGGSADACLFASRAPYEYACRAGVLNCPASYIQLGGESLLGQLRRAIDQGLDPSGSSFDTVERAEAERALALLGVLSDSVYLQDEVTGAAATASFHARLWRLGQTSAAFTCVEEVARRLAAMGVPVFTVQPTDAAISAALQVSTLLAVHRVLAESQLAVALAEVPTLRDTTGGTVPRHAMEEIRLTVHRFLVREAHRLQATVTQVNEYGFMILATVGSLEADAAGDQPIAAKARALLGIDLDVAVGAGRTQREAEERARLILGRVTAARPASRTQRTEARRSGSRSRRGQPAREYEPTGQHEQVRQAQEALPGMAGGYLRADPSRLRAHRDPGQAVDSLSRLRGLETLARLAQRLAEGATPVVDAETTGRLLSVTPRTARRQLRALVNEGLALPLPPSRTQHPGRPRHAYRLVVEKLERRAALDRDLA